MPLPADGPVTPGDLLTLEELGHLRRTSTWRGVGLVLHAWVVIAGATALFLLWPSGLTLGVAVLVIGTRQLGLMVLMHETAHWLLFRRGRLNIWVGTWLCAAPLGVDLKTYRRRHHLHHRHTQTPEDPDLALSVPLPVSRGRLAGALLGDLCGWTALTRIAGWRPWRDGLAETRRRLRAPLLANAVLCALLTALGGGPLYVLLWVLPWATWFQLVTRIRDIAEHGLVHDAADPLRNTRTVGAGFLARAFLAPYGVNYHLEHHLLVFVPCWKLPEVQALLLARDLGGRMERAASYADVLTRVTGGVIPAAARPRAGTDTR
ncbi:MAG TPA: fatty acid desaturase family protein [Methylomirabilota bacterium]|nr:fatty acid desaturase family protein [Methylomirabilota bacterium]